MTLTTLPTSPTDVALLRAYVRSRDDAAFGRLAARHGRALRQLAWRHVRDDHAAEEVAQAALIVLARRPKAALRSAKRRGDSVRPWLAKVAGYAASEHRRSEGRRRRREHVAARPEAVHDTPGAAELGEVVTAALASLPRRQRRLLTLRHIENRPWSEVAARLHTTPDAARKAASRAMAELRLALEQRGVTAAPAVVAAGLAVPVLSPSTSSAAPVLAAKVITMLKIQTTAVATTAAAVLVTAGLLTSTVVADDPPAKRAATTPAATPQDIDPAALARGVFAAESWLNDVDTFVVTYEQTSSRPGEPADYAAAPADWKPVELYEQVSVEGGFDQTRIFHREIARGDAPLKQKFEIAFDGDDVTQLMVYSGAEGEVARSMMLFPADRAALAGQYLQGTMPFGKTGGFVPWWAEPMRREAALRSAAGIDSAQLIGRETFRGRDVVVLAVNGGVNRFYVSPDDGLLRGSSEAQVPPERREEMMAAILAAACEAGHDAQSSQEAAAWIFGPSASVDADARSEAVTSVMKAMAELGEFTSVQWLDDYAEVAPGRFIPMTQGYELRSLNGEPGVEPATTSLLRIEVRLTSVRIDEPIDGAKFVVEPEGPVQVIDERVDPSQSSFHERWPEDDTAPADGVGD